MIAALLIFAYAVAVAWWLPSLLTSVTRGGASVRLGMTAWLAAMISSVTAAGIALAYLIRSTVNGWHTLAEAVCREVAGNACTPVVYRSALYELGLGIAAILATLTAMILTWRYGRRIQQAQRRTRAHAEAARITGRRLTAAGQGGMVVLDAPQPAAYCVPGRPGTIVVTSGALAVLEPAQLNAVVAHERAHLAGRHHQLIALSRGLGAVFPAVPLFSRGPAELARLAEMRADDVASGQAGRRPLIEALVAMRTGTPVSPTGAARKPVPIPPPTTTALPAAALAAAGYAVTARVERLLDPPPVARRTRYALVLISVLVVLPTLSAIVFALTGAS
jgi:beta-lactamase regulating signal transducer with metallopeptidase domain